ncbi:MAG: sigma-70 family RNA polymerase sigma factor [Deltaproteobacteria bacterium]|nr:sigma-70 family RNA polymerase sigma factor [Deltaproteobacteria bacterium]
MSRPIEAPEAPVRFSHFYRDHFPIAWRGLARLGVAPPDCEDATQDVFVTAYRRWHAFDGARERRAWLFGIVRKIAWRYRRGESRRTRRQRAFAAVEPAAICVETAVREHEAWTQLRAFLDGLDADKREAFVLGELEQLGRVELGAALGISPNTAYSRLQAARRRFFEHFAALGDDGCAHVLAHAEHVPRPPEHARAQVWIAIAPSIGAGAKAGAPIAAAIARAAGWGWTSKLAISAVALTTTAVAVGGLAAAPTEAADRADPIAAHDGALADTDAARTTPALLPSAAGARAVAVLDASGDQGSPSHRTRAPRGVGAAVGLPGDADLEAEIAMLIAAREAMIHGDSASARRELARHRARFAGHGRLVRLRRQIERELDTRMINLAGAGDVHVQEHE